MKQKFLTTALAISLTPALLGLPAGFAQTQSQTASPAPPSATLATPETKALREMHGVKLEMPRAEVSTLLGKPTKTGKLMDEFKLTGGDLLTVHYGPQGKVRVIQFYGVDAKRAPTWEDVVGDAPILDKPNGSKFARKVVSAEKFWVTMFQSKSGSLTTITLSRQGN